MINDAGVDNGNNCGRKMTEKIPKNRAHLQPQGDMREIKLKYNGATACVYIRDNQLINIFRRVVHTHKTYVVCLFL